MSDAKFVSEGQSIDHTSALDAGEVVVTGSLCYIAHRDNESGVTGAAAISGIFDIVKLAGQTFSVGSIVYWNESGRCATSTSSGNTRMGLAVLAAASGDATVRVAINY